ncbi:MAG TPA: hypothetical protein V6C72_07240 [Chroococcales cyanobacterium]
MPYISEKAQFTQVSAAVAAGTTAGHSSSIDRANAEGVAFLASFGTAASGNYFNLEDSDDNSNFNAVAGSKAVDSGGAKTSFVLDCFRGLKRYVRVAWTRGTSSTVEAVWAITYDKHNVPPVNATSSQVLMQSLSAADGTP